MSDNNNNKSENNNEDSEQLQINISKKNKAPLKKRDLSPNSKFYKELTQYVETLKNKKMTTKEIDVHVLTWFMESP